MKPMPLPPGQREAPSFERFGLPHFICRFPQRLETVDLHVRGDVCHPLQIGDALLALPRVDQVSDFHCVTTWSVRSLHWSGFRFSDFYEQLVLPQAQPETGADLVVFRGEDGYAAALPLADLLAAEVLLADRLDGNSLGIDHGAPLRLVAPAHYGYKSVKHITAIEFWRDAGRHRFPKPYPRLMEHPRARVALEERGIGVPAWLLRLIYRVLIAPTLGLSRHLLARYRSRLG